ncbi:MAG: prolyl-tRNA synthetase associated domain-containing protein [Vicinamibacterales bacterium]
MDLLKQPVFDALDRLGISYEAYEHPAVFTSQDADQYWSGIGGTAVKNLFLRNKKGDREYLVVLGIEKRADLKQLVRIIGDDRFSFGSAGRLMHTLGLTPGSVSPFGLLHENSRAVQVVIDADLRAADRLIFHPNINTASVTISFADLERFLSTTGNPVRYLDL